MIKSCLCRIEKDCHKLNHSTFKVNNPFTHRDHSIYLSVLKPEALQCLKTPLHSTRHILDVSNPTSSSTSSLPRVWKFIGKYTMNEPTLCGQITSSIVVPLLELPLPITNGNSKSRTITNMTIENHLISLKNLVTNAHNYHIGGSNPTENALLGQQFHAIFGRCSKELTAVAAISEQNVNGMLTGTLPRVLSMYVYAAILALENCTVSGVLDLRKLYSDDTAKFEPNSALGHAPGAGGPDTAGSTGGSFTVSGMGLLSEPGKAQLLQVAELIVHCSRFKELTYCHNMYV